MPTFCRHNRLLQNCPICSREQDVEMRPVVSSGTPASPSRDLSSPGRASGGSARTSGRSLRGASAADGRVRRLERSADDGYRSPLAPGLRSRADAERLATDLAFAASRLQRLASAPPGLYAEVADAGIDVEERAWLAFLIAYLCPLEGEDTIAAKRALGIGDPLLLERRSQQLADACGLPLAALDLGLFNWARPSEERATLGLGPAAEPDPASVDTARAALSV